MGRVTAPSISNGQVKNGSPEVGGARYVAVAKTTPGELGNVATGSSPTGGSIARGRIIRPTASSTRLLRLTRTGSKGSARAACKHNPADPVQGQKLPPLIERIKCVYDYHDAQGVVTYQVVRLKNPKDFRQRQPNPKKGEKWSMAGIELILYRLPRAPSRGSCINRSGPWRARRT